MKPKTMKPKNKTRKSRSLAIVQKYFPEVTEVVDAEEPVTVTVIPEDVEKSTGDPDDCAAAVACVREGKAEGAVIGIGSSYLVKGKRAHRLQTGVRLGREITSYDRHRDFASGQYTLAVVSPCNKLGTTHKRRYKGSGKNGPQKRKTARIRAL